MYILDATWFSDIFREMFYLLDKVIYGFISDIYNLLISIARTSVLTQGDISQMADRIYKLLAIFMIFKVTLSLITYIVNPDDFSDKTKGVAKLGTNIVISLALLILTPYAFNYAFKLQTIVLEDNALATLIFGYESDDNFLNTAGQDMAFITMSAFFSPNTSLTELYNCTDLIEVDSKGNRHFNEKCSGLSSSDYEDLGLDDSMRGLVDKDNFTEQELKDYVRGVEASSLGLMFRKSITKATAEVDSGKEYIIDYKYGFSTVVGVVVVLLLITFCMDVAMRSIKLAFLQLMAPIPIISYVDPKSGKDGLFKKWYQMCFKTFLSLFVRLLALYFAIFIISKVADGKMVDIIDGSYVSNCFIAIFIIIGALMFAKQLPKILEGLGIKLDGDGKFFLNPLKKLEDQALGGKAISRTAKGAAIAGVAGAAAFGANLFTTGSRVKNAKGFFGKTGAVFSSVGGALGASRRALVGGLKGEKMGKNFTNSFSGAMQARHDRVQRNQQGIGAFERAGAKLNKALGGMGYTEGIKNQVAAVEGGKGSTEGFTEALKQKYGDQYGTSRSNELQRSDYFKKSNKELETDKKVLKSKQEHIGAVMSGKEKIEGLVSKDRGNVKAKERNVKAVESRKDTDYISGKYGDLTVRYRDYMEQNGMSDRYNNPNATEEERTAILTQLAGMARNEDRATVKKELDHEIAQTIVADLSDPNEKAAANNVFANLKAEVLSTEDEELITAFNDMVEFDADGNLKLEGTEEEKTAQMMQIIDAFGTGTSGVIRHNASRVNTKINDEASLIDDIIDARSVQTSELQNSERARHMADVENSIGKSQ